VEYRSKGVNSYPALVKLQETRRKGWKHGARVVLGIVPVGEKDALLNLGSLRSERSRSLEGEERDLLRIPECGYGRSRFAPIFLEKGQENRAFNGKYQFREKGVTTPQRAGEVLVRGEKGSCLPQDRSRKGEESLLARGKN